MSLTMEKETKRATHPKSAAGVFGYKQISQEFKEQLAKLARSGQSVALLGPRYIGKRRCVEFVTSELEKDENVFIKRIDFGDGKSWNFSGKEFSSKLCELTKRDCDDEEIAIDKAFKDYLRDNSLKVILCISNLDLLADFSARQILKRIRAFHSASQTSGKFAVLLTGSAGLVPLVSGNNSEFDCAHQFVVRGYVRDEFFQHLDNSIAALGMHLEHDASEQLYKDCGNEVAGCSNVYLVRVFMWGLAESLRKGIVTREAKLSKSDVQAAWNLLFSPWSFPIDFVTSAITKVTLSSEAYRRLALLLDGKTINVTRNSSPTELELSGIAIRTTENKLVFSSPKMEEFAKLYYTSWTLGDLFCSKGEWEQAHIIYSSGQSSEIAERPHLEAAVQAFRAELYAVAGKGISEIEKFFIKFVSRLLPFANVSVWSQEPETLDPILTRQSTDNSWTILHGKQGVSESLLEQMPSPKLLQNMTKEFYFGPDLNPSFVLIPIPIGSRDCVRVIVLSNIDSSSVIAGSNLTLAKAVIGDFRQAVTTASEHDDFKQEAQLQSCLLRLLPDLLDRIVEQGGAIRNTSIDFVMQETSLLLAELDYEVVFALDVNKKMHFYDKRKSQTKSERYRVLQKYLRDNSVLPYFSLPGTVGKLMPLRGSGNRFLGTIEVSRGDGVEMHSAEIEAFKSFATQLAIVIGIAEQIRVFESAILESPVATVVVDEDNQICYANKLATKCYDEIEQHGWQSTQPKVDKILAEQQVEMLKQGKATSLVSFDESTLTHIYPVKGWMHDRIGTVVQVVEFNVIDQLFRQLTELGKCELAEDLLTGAMNALKEFGFPAARLYRVNNGRLIGRRIMNTKIPEEDLSDVHDLFDRGFVSLPAKQSGHSWNCLNTEEPIVFCVRKGKKQSKRLSSGVVAVNLQSAECPPGLKKLAHDVWIDLPLINRETNEPLGKLSIDCSEQISVAQVERLKVFAEFLSAVLSAKLERQTSVRQGLLQIIHEITNKVAPFKGLATRYLDLEKANDPQKSKQGADADFKRFNASISAELKKVAEKFPTKIEPSLQTTCIRECVENTLEEYGHGLIWDVQVDGCTKIRFDPELIAKLFSHLISNTKKAKDDALVKVSIKVVDAGCTIRYQNNGPPISRDRYSRIFEDFETKWKGSKTGSGIGLPLARRIAEAHNGFLRVVPFENGACFELSLPTQALEIEVQNGN